MHVCIVQMEGRVYCPLQLRRRTNCSSGDRSRLTRVFLPSLNKLSSCWPDHLNILPSLCKYYLSGNVIIVPFIRFDIQRFYWDLRGVWICGPPNQKPRECRKDWSSNEKTAYYLNVIFFYLCGNCRLTFQNIWHTNRSRWCRSTLLHQRLRLVVRTDLCKEALLINIYLTHGLAI